MKQLIKIVLKQISFFTKKAATGANGPIFNKFPAYRAANGLDLNYIGPRRAGPQLWRPVNKSDFAMIVEYALFFEIFSFYHAEKNDTNFFVV